MVWSSPGNKNCKQRFAVSVDRFCTESPVKLAELHNKGEFCSTGATDIEVFEMDVEKDKSLRPRRSVLYTEDVLPPKRCKTVGGNVFTKDCASIKQNRYINPERRNSVNVIRAKKRFGLVCDCVVKLERLSVECLMQYLPLKKEHRRPETRSWTQMHHIYEAGNCSYFQKSLSKHSGREEETQGGERLREGGIFDKQKCENIWGDSKLDSWGNVRYLRKEHVDFSESKEDWLGWWVHIDSFHSMPSAQLYSISDGVKESRTLVWDSAIEPVSTTQDKGIQLPELRVCVCDKKQFNEEACVGINFAVSDGEEAEFCGW
jgi:hypothetical protein